MSKRRKKPVLRPQRPQSGRRLDTSSKPKTVTVDSELQKRITERADELYRQCGGVMLEQMQNTIGLVLQDFTNQMRQRVDSGEDIKPLVTPYVAMRYMKENKQIDEERRALLDECLALAKQELDPQPNTLAGRGSFLEDKSAEIANQLPKELKIELPDATEAHEAVGVACGALQIAKPPNS
ncbi:hypothetical protein OAU50_01475 [Planctomycetota bacterium]|nr:hypothetical protein [Planctomycetota bacterium]